MNNESLVNEAKDRHIYLIPKLCLPVMLIASISLGIFSTLFISTLTTPTILINPWIGLIMIVISLKFIATPIAMVWEYYQILEGKRTLDGKRIKQEVTDGAEE